MNLEPHRRNGHHKVLVLNATFTPINICSWKRALAMIFKGKATSLEASSIYVNQRYMLPFVIKLSQYIPFSHNGVVLSRKNIYLRDNHICQYCGKNTNLTIDHIMPKSRGGSDSWENTVVACTRCNNRKGDHTPEEAGMKLKRMPYRPPSSLYLQMTRIGGVPSCWHDYFFYKKAQTN